MSCMILNILLAKLYIVPVVPRKWYTLYTIYLFLCTQSAYPNPFRGTPCSLNKWYWCNKFFSFSACGLEAVQAVPGPVRLRGGQRGRAHLRGGRRHRHPRRADRGRQLDGGRPRERARQTRTLPRLLCAHGDRLVTEPAHPVQGVINQAPGPRCDHSSTTSYTHKYAIEPMEILQYCR